MFRYRRCLLAAVLCVVVSGCAQHPVTSHATATVHQTTAAQGSLVATHETAASRSTTVPGGRPSPTGSRATTAGTATAVTAASTQSGVRTFRIVPEASEASYTIQEKFLERPLPNQAIGKTKAVSGTFEFRLSPHPTGRVVTLTVDLRTLQSDAPPRDERAKQWLGVGTYPYAEFRSTNVQDIPARYRDGEDVHFKLIGDLTLHGVTRATTFDVQGRLQGDTAVGRATTTIALKDFGIAVGSLLGLITIDDHATLALTFTARDSATTDAAVALPPARASSAPPQAHATTPPSGSAVAPQEGTLGTRNRIAFMSQRDGNDEIYVMNADGSAQTRLTRNTTIDTQPAWSPDGRRIAFVASEAMFEGNADIYGANTDGSGQTRLTDAPAFEGDPTWAPDGKHLAYASEVAGNLDI